MCRCCQLVSFDICSFSWPHRREGDSTFVLVQATDESDELYTLPTSIMVHFSVNVWNSVFHEHILYALLIISRLFESIPYALIPRLCYHSWTKLPRPTLCRRSSLTIPCTLSFLLSKPPFLPSHGLHTHTHTHTHTYTHTTAPPACCAHCKGGPKSHVWYVFNS